MVWFGKYYLQIISYFPKGFTSVCLRISTRYKAIFINAYFNLTVLEKICRFKKVLKIYLQISRIKSFFSKIKLYPVYKTIKKIC